MSIVPTITATIVRLGRSEAACCAAINILAHIARNDANKAEPAMVGGPLQQYGAVSATLPDGVCPRFQLSCSFS